MKNYYKIVCLLGTSLLVACTPPQQSMLSEEQIKSIVLEEIPNGKIVEIAKDFDDKAPNYDVKITEGNTAYEIEIDAYNGTILKREEDISITSPLPNTTPNISEEKAKEIALQQAPGGQIMKLTYENDQYNPYYDIKMTLGNHEYNIEINAITGELIKNNKEILD